MSFDTSIVISCEKKTNKLKFANLQIKSLHCELSTLYKIIEEH